MTSEAEILSGVELDRAVAERVMGWTLGLLPGDVEYWREEHVTLANWTPSLDISQAWRVVEKMRERGWGFHLSVPLHRDGVIVSFYRRSGDPDVMDDSVGYEGQSAPDAICRAALTAVAQEGK